MLASLVRSADWWNFLADIAVVGGALWGVLAGASVFYHKYQMHELSTKIEPMFEKVNDRLDAQDVVLKDVQHEVTLNNGGSVKDSVNRIERNQQDEMAVRAKLTTTVEKIDRDLTTHLGVHKGIEMAQRGL